jgi:hypothetical protein
MTLLALGADLAQGIAARALLVLLRHLLSRPRRPALRLQCWNGDFAYPTDAME